MTRYPRVAPNPSKWRPWRESPCANPQRRDAAQDQKLRGAKQVPVQPTAEQIQELVTSKMTGPVVMLNLLRFDSEGGRESFGSYVEGLSSVLEATGARVLWQGRADSLVIGGIDERWDVVVLVEYPSRQAFLEMVSSPDYRKIGKRRTAALVDSRLIACTQLHAAGLGNDKPA